MSLTRNCIHTGRPCGHCGRGLALWLCPSGFRCVVCPDCAGVCYYRPSDEKRADGSMPPPSGWPRLLAAPEAPIIEIEAGPGWGAFHAYVDEVREMLRAAGVDSPLLRAAGVDSPGVLR